ncbi:MAG: hypothetical protein CR963_00780 [Gammaproteobacteria bacterium]|nr:MAG: hypothetical protein CR963_00780 [Gammaproteobacteria bacterium]
MREAVAALKIDPNAKVTPELQERIFSSFLLRGKRPDIEGYITGRHDDLERAQIAGAREWASIARPDTGKSHYDGDASGNVATRSLGSRHRRSRPATSGDRRQ